MSGAFRYATSWPCVRRALIFAAIVGPVLIVINHGDRLLQGELDSTRLAKMALTVAVPFVVSTLSSVGAFRQHRVPAVDNDEKRGPA